MLGAPEDAARAYDQIPIPLFTVAGPEHRLVACNTAFEDRYAGEHLALGRTPGEMWPGPDGLRLCAILDDVVAHGEPAAYPDWRQDGESPGGPDDVVADLTVSPFREHGRVAGLHLTLVEVTAPAARPHGGLRPASRPAAVGIDVVTAVQDELLPGGLPLLPDLDVAASYALASGRHGAGGDWFDCVPRPDGTVALVVGDVVGHGVAAAAAMGQLRAVLQDRLLAGDGPAAALEEVSSFARLRQESRAATACVLVLDRLTGRMEYATAGHPPPLVVRRDGTTAYLTPTGGAPLATGGQMTLGHAWLDLDEVVLLYTDGIVTRPRRTAAESTVELADVVAEAVAGRGDGHDPTSPRAVARVTELGLEQLFPGSGYDDDSTLLAAQRVRPPADLHQVADADPAGVLATRRAVADWLAPLEAGPVDVLAVLHVVGELVTNAAEHAYRDRPGGQVATTVALRADGTLDVQVRDQGGWRPAYVEGESGRGLGMVRALVDRLDVDTCEEGTTATVQVRLGRPAQLLAHQGGLPAREEEPEVPFAVEVHDDRVRVRGPVDVGTAELLLGHLYQASGDGRRALDVDLAGVTHLASAGVQALHELVEAGVDVRLRAPYGSVAQHVLELVRLPYDARTPPW